ncbi:glycogen synthase kinase binding protein [Austrofundulus limnaeus]|uniref:Glycogen synthase kinase binding protein n=1 Tax=Austrofundulus limnaeus TaxID=52670 RepID=A0A2I4DC35_AUSLI|nr:PREDICTED: GSK-3-binding protein-like [Austrofundulus limnaeus]
MPGLEQNFLVLEQSVSVDSKDVDALVTRIEGVLQLHSTPVGLRSGSVPTGPVQTHSCCLRLRNQRTQRGSPYQLPSSRSDQDQNWDQIRPWNRKRVRTDEADPHRVLQDLVLSGNLIKEAVRRLQFSQLDCGDLSWTRTQDRGPDNVPCS